MTKPHRDAIHNVSTSPRNLRAEVPVGVETDECSMPLTPRELSEVAGELDRRHASLLAEIRDTLGDDGHASLALADQGAGDIGDRSVSDVLAEFSVAMIDRHVNELREVEQARMRIAKRVFGTCTDCGAAIPLERLRAYPSAKRCLTCQRRHEHDYAHLQTPTI